MAGRTGRMGKAGEAYTVMVPDNIFRIQKVFRYLSVPFPINLKEEQQKVAEELDEEGEPKRFISEDVDTEVDVDETVTEDTPERKQNTRKPKYNSSKFKKFSKYRK